MNTINANSVAQFLNAVVRVLPIWSFFLLPICTLSIYPQNEYEACKPFECGGLNISYPFYFPPKQPSYCGFQGFEVSCNNKNQTIINLYDDDYIIHDIWYNDLTIIINNSAFSSSVFRCPSSIHNLTLDADDRFSFAPRHKDILLLQNCSGKPTTSHQIYKNIKCDDNQHPYVSFQALFEENYHPGEFGNCTREVVVPYDDEYEYEHENSDIEGILRRGIVLTYETNNCTRCQESGGRCGWTDITSEFLCFCPDVVRHGSCYGTQTQSHSEAKCDHCKTKKWKITLAAVLSAIVLIILIFLIVYWRKRKNTSQQSTFRSTIMSFHRTRTDLEGVSMQGVTVFSYSELEEATHNFDPNRELGEGGFGIVYYGKLKDGREVAVKRLYEKNYKRIEQFMNEIQILTKLRHKNLVTLYGCTSRHSRELLLVYEYIPNKTVADHLHGDQTKSVLLPWSTRMNIAIETATALFYLHTKDIIHRDVKTNNILLDNNFSVKVADFGLSRLFPADVTHISTAPQGTPGYVDPEYHQCYHLTDKSDVYSFGVVLVELISSLPAVDVGRHRHEINLSNYAMNRIQTSAFSELVDPNLGFETDFKVRRMTTLVGELAFRCLQHERELRPSMEEVVEVLKRIETMDYDALEAEEMNMSTMTTIYMKPPPSPTDNDDVRLLRNTGQQPPSPISVMDKWLNSSKSTTPATSRSS